MLLAHWLDVPDAMAFLDAFAEAAEKTRGWKLESIKFDYGYQFVYVRYTGRKFAGNGLMASAFAPLSLGERVGVRAGFSSHSTTPQRVNLTLHADEWPTHTCFGNYSPERLLAPLLKRAILLRGLPIAKSNAGS